MSLLGRMGEFRGTGNEDDAKCGKDCSTDSYMDNSSNTNDDDYAECSLVSSLSAHVHTRLSFICWIYSIIYTCCSLDFYHVSS